jgi:predicted O-methyltransferase YrrM
VLLHLIRIADVLASPVTLLAAFLLKLVRTAGVARMPISLAIFRRVGVFPIRDHYYEPLFNPKRLRNNLQKDRILPGIDFNVPGQLALLSRFSYSAELEELERSGRFDFSNPAFGRGDGEYLYSIIRHFRPRSILEVGSGFSTIIAHEAVTKNGSKCRHICVEPYENTWLSQISGIEILRKRIEDLDIDRLIALEQNDILFIDSSHIIRPRGDVLFLFLEVIPQLASGVLIHIHDIFTPRDYPQDWILEEVRFWNEQYLLEAFLTHNSQFRVIAGLNYLHHNHAKLLYSKCPMLAKNPQNSEPGSFWIVRA